MTIRQYFEIKETPTLTIPQKFWFIGWWTLKNPLTIKFPINLKGYIEGDPAVLLDMPNMYNINSVLSGFFSGIRIVFTEIYGIHIDGEKQIELRK